MYGVFTFLAQFGLVACLLFTDHIKTLLSMLLYLYKSATSGHCKKKLHTYLPSHQHHTFSSNSVSYLIRFETALCNQQGKRKRD